MTQPNWVMGEQLGHIISSRQQHHFNSSTLQSKQSRGSLQVLEDGQWEKSKAEVKPVRVQMNAEGSR